MSRRNSPSSSSNPSPSSGGNNNKLLSLTQASLAQLQISHEINSRPSKWSSTPVGAAAAAAAAAATAGGSHRPSLPRQGSSRVRVPSLTPSSTSVSDGDGEGYGGDHNEDGNGRGTLSGQTHRDMVDWNAVMRLSRSKGKGKSKVKEKDLIPQSGRGRGLLGTLPPEILAQVRSHTLYR